MHQRPLLYAFAFLITLLATAPALAGGSKAVGPFPVREPEEGTALRVMYEVLKAGVDTDPKAGLKAYKKLVLKNRKSSKEADQGLLQKEWDNLRAQAGSYLLHDTYGFKVMVEEMNPGPAFVNRKTKKAYITLRNKLEGDERRGLLIIERNAKGKWRLRSVNL
jgi:hypothetical protein